MFYLYILFSPSLQKYYIGYTGDFLPERIRRHNSNHRGFTGKTNDWELAYSEAYPSKAEAARREQQLKRWKSHQRIRELIDRQQS